MVARVQQPAPAFEATAVVDGFFEVSPGNPRLFLQLGRTHLLAVLQTVKLEQYKGKWVVLFFYPLDCTLLSFRVFQLFSPGRRHHRYRAGKRN